jgi:malate dehydrogenase (oxaloacetate-decarboxylating)
MDRWPQVLLQWENFARADAGPLLQRYSDRLLTFNDDIQGTAAVCAGTLLAAVKVTGLPLTQQSIVFVGAGSAGCGIGALLQRVMTDAGLSEKEARERFYAIDRDGLLVDGMKSILDFQQHFMQGKANVGGWACQYPDRIGLLDVVKNAKPTVLIGVSAQGGIFNEQVIRAMGASVARPVRTPPPAPRRFPRTS